jgi:hypothetical protein
MKHRPRRVRHFRRVKRKVSFHDNLKCPVEVSEKNYREKPAQSTKGRIFMACMAFRGVNR